MIGKVSQVQTTDRVIGQIQSNIITPLNLILSNPITDGILLQNVTLSSGDNSINHKLGRKLQGWFIVRQRASASIYDKQDSNSLPDKTLSLNASAQVTVDLYVF